MLSEDYEKALESQKKPILWKKVGDRQYVNVDTGVEIKYGWDRKDVRDDNDWAYGWYTYAPIPDRFTKISSDLSWRVFGRQYSYEDAVKYDGEEAVQEVRFSREDRSYAEAWEPWSTYLDETFYADRHPV